MIKIRFLFVILVLLVAVLCQRGGGSRRSSSRRSSSSSYRSSGYRSRRRSTGRSLLSLFSWIFGSDNSTNTTTNEDGDEWDEKTTNSNKNKDEEQSESQSQINYGFIGVIIAALGGLGYIGYKSEEKKKIERAKKFENMMTEYEGSLEGNMCTLSDTKMDNLKDWFMSNKWRINFKTRNFNFRDDAQVRLKSIQNKSGNSYKISMDLTDSIGSSSCQGILVHQKDYFGIMFEKTYHNRTEAGQTGDFDMLVYEGVQQGEVFRGTWAYKGYENSSDYSGTWEMTHN